MQKAREEGCITYDFPSCQIPLTNLFLKELEGNMYQIYLCCGYKNNDVSESEITQRTLTFSLDKDDDALISHVEFDNPRAGCCVAST